ncbi:MAG: hypothetical protein N2645_00675 [Clostridia bacterium]|nr:hypothetical protein [Clostridia bacterium]
MGKIKNLWIGSGVFGLNLAAGLIQSFRPEGCTGACGKCSFGCAAPAAGMVGIGLAALWGKLSLKRRLNNKKRKSI